MATVNFAKEAGTADQAGEKVKNLVNPNNTKEEVVKMYDDWTEHYEKDQAKNKWKFHEVLSKEIQKTVSNKNVKILDVGAGTGFHGLELHRAGYSCIDGVEPSESMMQIAKERGIYDRLIQDYVGKNRLDVKDNTYDVITGAGVFVPAHVTTDSFEELHRVTKPGGVLFLSVSERYYEDQYQGFGEKFDNRIGDFVDKGMWVLESRTLVDGYLAHYRAYVNVVRKI